jgi:rhodanese-related sulfurtransferase
MRSQAWHTWTSLFLLLALTVFSSASNQREALANESPGQQVATPTSFITADELKAKLSKNEPVMIIDVRSANGLGSEQKIKGAVHVKLRRLKYRLNLQPLKSVPRDRDVVTYCACPNDEVSVRAAEILRQSGFKRVHVLKGGWIVWKKANGQMEPMARGI